MIQNPYEVLGVTTSATDADIKTAYRTLAKRLHPDVDPSNTRIVERFKEITAAYELLKDPVRRRRFDRGEIDSTGTVRRRRGTGMRDRARQTADGAGPGEHASNWAARRAARAAKQAQANSQSQATRQSQANGQAQANGHTKANGQAHGSDHPHPIGHHPHGQANGDARGRYSDLFSDFFGGVSPDEARATAVARGEDQHYRLTISFLEASNGITRRLRLAEGRRIDVRIPPGIQEGQQIRLKGAGITPLEGPPGDALISIEIEPHAYFTRRGLHILMDLPVSLSEAVLGGRVKVPTIEGPVQIAVPPGSNTGTTLRLRGRGIRPDSTPGAAEAVPGDQFVTLKLVLPDDPPKDFVKTVREWSKTWTGNVRASLDME